MRYRTFGAVGWEASLLGFGCMRLPTLDGDESKINEAEAIHMIRHAIDGGVNYVDTAYNYHRQQSEVVVGRALLDGYRERVRLATKLPVWLAKRYEDFDRLLNEQLQKLQTDHIDFYLLHSLNRQMWTAARDLGVLRFLDQALADGRIRHAGFSFHDSVDLFHEIVDAYPWTFCQIQLNYVDQDYQAGLIGLRYAAEKGLAVIIMEPLKGGKLVQRIPEEAQAVWDRAAFRRSPVEWAFHWIASHPEVTVILSGMSTVQQVEDNLGIMSRVLPNGLSSDELSLVDEVKAVYDAKVKVGCTSCQYCLPCPQGVLIPDIFEFYNNYSMFNAHEEALGYYNWMRKGKHDASVCVECGHCESRCPQSLPIIRHLREAALTLGGEE